MASVSPILTRHDPGIQKERDEFTYLLHFGWLETAEVLAWLAAHKPPMLHLISTGRNAPRALIEAADLVIEMREVQHPLHTQGIRAQKGIEF